MAASSSNTDVILGDIASAAGAPSCPHGPALLFERYTQSKGCRKFYACSAFRDNKLCGFFRWADDASRKKADNPHATDTVNSRPGQPLSHAAYRKRFLQFKQLPVSERVLCCLCGLLLLPGEVTEHQARGHRVKRGIKKAALRHPTSLFDPQEDNKTYAQYLFSDSVVKFLVHCLEEVNHKTHLLCVGTPRLHEAVTNLRKEGQTRLTSLLLDLDHRYAQIYSKKAMCRYNMFNHHFFDAHGEDELGQFLQQGGAGVVLVTDPPFGGMVEALGATFTRIQQTWRDRAHTDRELPIVWFFPYFMEKRICECLPSLSMLDYKVDYDNHNLFQTSEKGARKKGSPVRMFTNMSPLSFPLPADLGYWFCEECQRFSAPENQHCSKCNSCTSKDGTTYRHCEVCERCVKATRMHCQMCGVCDLPGHTCGQRHAHGCYICGALDHKRRDCPQRHKPSYRNSKRKRPAKQLPDGTNKKQHT